MQRRSVMSNLLRSLSLLYFLQYSVSSDDAVSLNCTNPPEVKFGDAATVNCSIQWKDSKSCEGVNFTWKDADEELKCNKSSGKYIRDGDGRSYGFLTISDVKENHTITVELSSYCGLAIDSIQVQVGVTPVTLSPLERSHKEEDKSYLLPSILAVVGTVTFVAILSVLIKYHIAKKKKETHQHLNHMENL